MAFDKRFLDELRDRLRLSQVIGRHVRLQRAGNEFKACCPFHQEKSPSFYVNDHKGFFHCFGCGAHGDILDFAMRHLNLSFVESVEMMAGEAGLTLPQPKPAERQRAEHEKDLRAVVEDAARFFQACLTRPVGTAAAAYLASRGLSAEAIARFRLGYAPADGAALVAHLTGDKGHSADSLVLAGLARRRQSDGSLSAFFRDRVMFPVGDRRGRIIAFGGRVLPGAAPDQPKYINTPETPLFAKGSLLYGLAQAQLAAREGHRAIVVEGYTDVIALSEAGFRAAVAPLGTAFTAEQAQALWRLAGAEAAPPVLCFDGDKAGRRAAVRALDQVLPLIAPERRVTFAFLPDGQDPDSLVRSAGPSAVQAVLDAARTLAEMVWDACRAEHPPGDAEANAALEHALTARAQLIGDRTTRDWLLRDLRGRLNDAAWEARRAARMASAGAGAGARGPGRGSSWGRSRQGGRWRGPEPPDTAIVEAPPPARGVHQRQALLALALALRQPALVDAFAEELVALPLEDAGLQALAEALVSQEPGAVGADGFLRQTAGLIAGGFGATIERLFARLYVDELLDLHPLLRSDADGPEPARLMMEDLLRQLREGDLRTELHQAARRLGEAPVDADVQFWSRWQEGTADSRRLAPQAPSLSRDGAASADELARWSRPLVRRTASEPDA